MLQRSRIPFFSRSLGLLTLLALLLNRPAGDEIGALWLFFAALVALTLNLGMVLDGSLIAPAMTSALMAYLTLGRGSSAAAALWSVAAGALAGYLVLVLRRRPGDLGRRDLLRLARNASTGIAQLTLGLLVSGWAYRALGGSLPLARLGSAELVPLLGLIVLDLAITLDLWFLQAYFFRRRPPRQMLQHWQPLMGSLLLPLPFAVLGAVAYHSLSDLAFAVLIAGFLIVVSGIHVMMRTQVRFRQQVLELSALSAIGAAMRTNLDLAALLEVVYREIARLLDAPNFTVALLDPSRNMLYFPLHVLDRRVTRLEPREAENGLVEVVIREKKPLLIPDQVMQHAQLMGVTPPPGPVYSWLGVPLLAADRALGCVVLQASRPGQPFTENDLRLLMTVAAQAGIAIDNAQLYDQSRDRSLQLTTLNNVATVLSGTLDVQQILELVGSSAVAVANCDAVAVYLWWQGPHRPLALAGSSGLSEAFTAHPPYPLLLGADELQRRRQPLVVADVAIDPRTRHLRDRVLHENKRAWVEVLLSKGDDLLGVLVFYYDEPGHFTPDAVELLRNFANQAALAISNARLYSQTDAALDRRVEQLSALAEISRELTSTLDLQGLFGLVLERALEATRSQVGALLLRGEEDDERPQLVAARGEIADLAVGGGPHWAPVTEAFRTGQPVLVTDQLPPSSDPASDSALRAQLNVPIAGEGDVLGVIALGSRQPDAYGPDDLSFVTQLATQARIAIDNARLFSRIEIARDRLQIILDSMKEAVILISREGRITLANPRVRLLLGLDPQALLERPLAPLVSDSGLGLAGRLGFTPAALLDLSQRLQRGLWDESSRDGGRVTFEIATPKPRFLDRTEAPIRDDSGRILGLLMVYSDVTQERALIQAREDLSNMIIHDLRGPLTAITTSLKLLNEIAPEDDALGRAVRQTTDMSSRAARKLLNLVNSLLDISKIESGVIALERETVPLARLAGAVVDEFAPLAAELEVELVVTLPPDLPLLSVDEEKIERVLLNLVDNALKFTPAEGLVTVGACLAGGAGEQDGRWVRVEVADTGPGIPDESKERLFDRYAQLEGPRGRRRGTGLGLTFCRLAVEAHGGRIWVEDNPLGGTIFAFTLPAVEGARSEDDE